MTSNDNKINIMNEDLRGPNLLVYTQCVICCEYIRSIVVAFKCVIARRARRNHNLFDCFSNDVFMLMWLWPFLAVFPRE